MTNPENIIPPKKGEVRNPNGRPKGSRNRRTIVREMLQLAGIKDAHEKVAEILGVDHKSVKIEDQMTAAIVKRALNGNITAYQELMNAAYGKIEDKVNNTHSFNKMDTVKVDVGDNKPKPLTFDIGSEALHNKQPEED